MPIESLRFHSASAETSRELGAALGRAAFAGAVLLLEGALGAGKTVLAQGVARGLDVAAPVSSPSFPILNVYAGRLVLFHLDLYRVERPGELRALDLEELFGSGGVTVVEWPRWLLELPPPGTLEIRLEARPQGERRIELATRDPRWSAAFTDLAAWPVPAGAVEAHEPSLPPTP